jgi:hypothetical protein
MTSGDSPASFSQQNTDILHSGLTSDQVAANHGSTEGNPRSLPNQLHVQVVASLLYSRQGTGIALHP